MIFILSNFLFNLILKINKEEFNKNCFEWGLGIGDWGLGIGPNPQSPIPKFKRSTILYFIKIKYILFIY
jgi:hypothetical protein